jgi:PleD family two-component response regulator
MPKESLLLIDPFSNLLNAFKMILEVEGYQVETSMDLKEAGEKLSQKNFAVIVSECYPPYEDIALLVKKLKEKSPGTYVILNTSLTPDEAAYETLLASGVDELFIKPYPPKQLSAHIKKGLRHKELVQKKLEAEQGSLLDPLAQTEGQFVFNSGYFKKYISQELKKARRHSDPLSLILLNLPAKEKKEENYERFYLELTKILRKNLREEDVLGRENGNLGILLYKTDPQGSQALEQRIAKVIQKHPLFTSNRELTSLVENLSFRHITYPGSSRNSEFFQSILKEN